MKSIIAILVTLLCVANGFSADAESHIYKTTYKVKKRVVLTIHLTSQYSLPSGTYNVQINGSPLQNLTSFSHPGGVIDRTISGIGALTLTQPDSSVPSSWNRVFVQLNKVSNGVNYSGYGGRVFTGERKDFTIDVPSDFETETVYETLSYVVGEPPTSQDVSFQYYVRNDSLDDSTIRLKVDGAIKASVPIPGRTGIEKVYVADAHTESMPPGQTGTYQWEVLDKLTGVWHIAATGTYTASPGDGIPGVDPEPLMLVIKGGGPPPPEPDPSPFPSPTPSPTPPLAPGSSGQTGNPDAPGKGSNVGPPKPGGAVIDMTNLDVYEDVRAALNQAGNGDTTVPPVDGAPALDGQPDVVGDTDTITMIYDTTTGALSKTTEGISGFKSQFSSDKALKLPSVGGGPVLAYTFNLPYLGAISVDISAYSSYVNWVRNFMLMIIYIEFWFVTIHVIRSGIA